MDASAITAFLRGEAGNDIVEERLLDVNTDCIMHAVNLCEVFMTACAAAIFPHPSKRPRISSRWA